VAKQLSTAAPSIIERTRVPLARLPGRAARAQGRSHDIGLHMERQLHSNWCWAAVATSVAKFYAPASRWTQCLVVSRELGRKTCCRKGANGSCNVAGHLQKSLKVVGHAEHPPYIKRSVSFGRAQREIDAGRPLGVRTQWAGSVIGHFVAVVGYHKEFDMLTVADPYYGRQNVDYEAFRNSYRGIGTWTHSYYTKH
jgi:hypothetical protein